MAAPKQLIRTDEKAGSVDLSLLALPEDDYNRPDKISFLGKCGLWYNITPYEDTKILVNNTIFPLKLQRTGSSGPPENVLDASIMGLRFARNWLQEGYKFPRLGVVSLANEVIHEGDPLTIGGIKTGPISIAWVTERVDPDSDVKAGEHISKKQDDGMWKLVGYRTVANF